MSNILQRDGLTIELLGKLSYKLELGINLKKRAFGGSGELSRFSLGHLSVFGL
jgi:hypothetical protein